MNAMRALAGRAGIALVAITAIVSSANAEFFGWQVTGVATADVLNVRAWPASYSRILIGYPNGTPLSLTGKCSGGVDLDDIAGLPAVEQAEAVRFRWCEVWLDPLGDGNFRTGWVYGRYIRPL